MNVEAEKIEKAKEFMKKMASGINPLNGEQLQSDSLLNDAGIIRGFYFVADVLDHVERGSQPIRNRISEFKITQEQKKRVIFPEGKIGVNQFSRYVNACLDLAESKRLTGVELNKRLKKLGVLSEQSTNEGKTTTITNEKSLQYGFEAERRSYNGREYDMVLMNHIGKKYLLDNLESIMAIELKN